MIESYLKQWLKKALNDISVMQHELALPEEEIITESVCFHAQQAAEKLLKAYLIYKEEDVKKTHNLILLLEFCSGFDRDFLKFELSDLNFYAVQVRYPGDYEDPTIEDSKHCYVLAIALRDFVLQKMEISEEEILA